MKFTALALAGAMVFAPGSAFAACPDTSAVTQDTNTTAGISKDGTRAPLQTDEGEQKPTAKDGKSMPLATEEGGGNKNLATSQQDVEAQQQGEKTAAATADDACKE